MVMHYAILPKHMYQNIKYNTIYDSLSTALAYMSVATLYVGQLRMVKLLECITISSQTMASKYAYGLLFYRTYCCMLRSGGSWSSHTLRDVSLFSEFGKFPPQSAYVHKQLPLRFYEQAIVKKGEEKRKEKRVLLSRKDHVWCFIFCKNNSS
jgi:hypothetical protein